MVFIIAKYLSFRSIFCLSELFSVIPSEAEESKAMK